VIPDLASCIILVYINLIMLLNDLPTFRMYSWNFVRAFCLLCMNGSKNWKRVSKTGIPVYYRDLF